MFFETTRFHRTTRPIYLSYKSFTEATTPDYGLVGTVCRVRRMIPPRSQIFHWPSDHLPNPVPQTDVITALALNLRVLNSQLTTYDINSYQQINKQSRRAGTLQRSTSRRRLSSS
jgi:hypothetical protein